MPMKIGAAYVRVSTTDQLDYSPESQLKLIRDHAKKAGYVIPDDHVFQDGGISGKSADKRPAFRLMIATAKEDPPPFTAIFVWKYSRFARNQEEAIMYKNLLRKRGVDVCSISEPSSDSPYASLIERIIEWMDEFYLINLSGEVKRGMAEKATRGEVMGKAPFGYRAENKILVPDERADAARYIFELYAGGAPLRTIAAKLKEAGVKTVRGKYLETYGIGYILRNPAYIGKTRWDDEPNNGHKYRVVGYRPDVDSMPDGKHVPLISRELWDKVQARIAENEPEIKYVRSGDPIIFPLKGIVRCSACGATLVRTSRRSVPALQCYRYSRGQCSVSHSLKMEKMEAIVFAAIREATNKNDFSFAPPEQTRKPRLLQDWDKLIAAEKNRLKRAREAYLNGTFDEDEYAEAKKEVNAALGRLEEQKRKEMKDETPSAEEYRQKVSAVLEVLESPDMDGEAKNRALLSIVDRIVYNKNSETVDIFYRF